MLLDYQVALDNGTKCDFDAVKANLEVALVSLNIFVEKIEELKQQIRSKERTWFQTQGKLQVDKVDGQASRITCSYENRVIPLFPTSFNL